MHPRVYTAGWFIAVLIISAMGFEFITPHHISTAQSDSSGIVPAIHTNTEITSLSSSRASQTIPCDETALNAAETHFQELKAADPGTVPDADLEAAARDFVARSEPCYRQMITEGNLHIDDGGLWATDYTLPLFYVLFGTKWGISGFGNPGEVVTYSFMPNGVSMSYEAAGTNTAIQSLNGYQSCFLDNIRDAFNAWSAIADIEFMEVVDSNTPANAVGADGDIRIGAHNMGGQFGTIAHAYYPPPNGISIAGDLHFDTSEVWSCTTSGGLDIGLVALHEIGHSIGLGHETTLLAVMNPTYNPSVAVLQTDDINGARVIYGAADVPTPTNTNLVANSNFTSGENNWNFFNIPQHQVDGSNVLNTNANGGNAVWQYTGYDVPGGTPLQASISLNNTDSTGGSKQVKVVLHNNTWTDWMVCDFILPAGNPGLQTHILRGTTAADWDNIGIDIYDYTSNGWAWLQMDNVSVLRLESLDSALPSCQSPAAAQNTNLVLNSVFSSPYLNATDSWGIFGTDSYSVNSGVLNYNATLNSANAVFQLTGKSVPTGSPLELTIDMNNTSTGNKLIGVVIHDHTFSEYFSCVFLVPGDNPGLHTYTVRNTTTRQWGNVWVDIYDWT
ncbi:MAG TPA: matrixin family metalloprotease, partial [Aggregatilineales bacterium]|nr:matrixin family metalloprotease [Aggregatilineales bacterium]